ncbi:MAG TPA: 4'-phosphopantetheinyl transferase superfamily protein [Marinilabiliaceae bacterium]|nr:4'-phosphopantetheinyl transferase superfamily protein [Marinilabiliaceae bacterium]
MAVIFEKSCKNRRLAVWEISESEEELLTQLQLTEETSAQLLRMTHPKKRLEWLATRILLQKLSGCYDKVRYTNNGKPFFKNNNFGFSISHTNGYAAVVVAEDQLVGIDIEHPSPRISKLAWWFLNAKEQAFINSDAPEVYHALLWCAKETAYKVVDFPGLEFKNHIITQPFSAEEEGTFKTHVLLDRKWTEYELNYFTTNDYYLVWHW